MEYFFEKLEYFVGYNIRTRLDTSNTSSLIEGDIFLSYGILLPIQYPFSILFVKHIARSLLYSRLSFHEI